MKIHLIIYGIFEDDHCMMVGSTERPLFLRIQEYRRNRKTQYKWFNPEKHEHRILWQGIVASDDRDSIRFIRAAKETMWIGKMHTWFPEGKNQTNPLIQMLGMPISYAEMAAIGALHQPREAKSRGGSAACAIIHKLYPNLAKENGRRLGEYNCVREYPSIQSENSRKARVKGGRIGGRRVHELHPEIGSDFGRKYGSKGGKRNHELHPGLMRENGVKGGRRYVELYGPPGTPESRRNNTGDKDIGLKIGPIARHQRWHVNRKIWNPRCTFCFEVL